MFILSLIDADTMGHDDEVRLILEVHREQRPIYLSDFVGGEATLVDTYSTNRTKYNTLLYSGDERRLLLKPLDPKEKELILSPSFKRVADPINQLEALPLNKKEKLILNSGSASHSIYFSIFEFKEV